MLNIKFITMENIKPIVTLCVMMENNAKVNAERFINPSIEIFITPPLSEKFAALAPR